MDQNQNFVNARDGEQRRRMQILAEKGLCYLCRQGSEEDLTLPNVIYEGEHLYVTPNNFPVDGSICHVMIVPKRHLTNVKHLSSAERIAIFDAHEWVQTRFNLPGYSVYVRVGDMAHTGATQGHLHFQLIAGVKRTESHRVPEDIIYVPLGAKQI